MTFKSGSEYLSAITGWSETPRERLPAVMGWVFMLFIVNKVGPVVYRPKR